MTDDRTALREAQERVLGEGRGMTPEEAQRSLDYAIRKGHAPMLMEWEVISAELDRLRKRVVAFEQSAPRLYRCNEENCYLCDADMRHLFPGIDVAALRVSQPEGVASRRPEAAASDPEKEGRDG